jgi:hypothetical protein
MGARGRGGAGRPSNLVLGAVLMEFPEPSGSEWYFRAVGRLAPVYWDVRPIHLHS